MELISVVNKKDGRYGQEKARDGSSYVRSEVFLLVRFDGKR